MLLLISTASASLLMASPYNDAGARRAVRKHVTPLAVTEYFRTQERKNCSALVALLEDRFEVRVSVVHMVNGLEMRSGCADP